MTAAPRCRVVRVRTASVSSPRVAFTRSPLTSRTTAIASTSELILLCASVIASMPQRGQRRLVALRT